MVDYNVVFFFEGRNGLFFDIGIQLEFLVSEQSVQLELSMSRSRLHCLTRFPNMHNAALCGVNLLSELL